MMKNNIRKIPFATYRLQMNRHFRFRQAFELVDYIQRFGISTLYTSPLFKAVPGSLHGYDNIDPTSSHRADLNKILTPLPFAVLDRLS